MGLFISPVAVELISESPRRWRLTSPLLYRSSSIKLDNDKPGRAAREMARDIIVVPIGFETNFASVPRVPLVWWLTGDRATAAAALHDWLYTIQCFTRAQSDLLFLEAMKATKINWALRRSMYAGVRLGAGSVWAGVTHAQREKAAALLAAWIDDVRRGPAVV